MVLNAALLNAQYYKISIKGKMKQSREESSILLNTLVYLIYQTPPLG